MADKQPNEVTKLEKAIAALDEQRAILGDDIVDASIAALRAQIAVTEFSPPLSPPLGGRKGGRGLRGERRLVTIMFADVSGFTAMSERLDPEVVRDLMNDCFEQLVPVVERYGGTVDKFIGDEIMALFGAPTAHENDPERALRAAIEMQAELETFNQQHATDLDSELGLHFGINTGHVIAGGLGTQDRQQYSVMGDAVNLAARLEDLSERGEILVGPDTYRLTAPLFSFEARPAIRVKGKQAPVTVYHLLEARAEPGSVRGIEGLSSPLVGRDGEFRALQEAVDRLGEGVGGIVTVVGEAGLGKSRLVAEVRACVAPGTTTLAKGWIEGRCLSYGASTPYLLWLDVLRGLLGISPDAAPAVVNQRLLDVIEQWCPDCAADVYPYLGRLMSLKLADDIETRLGGLDAQSLQFITFRAIETLICNAAQQSPLVLVCEDLHWADSLSLDLLEQMLACAEQAAILFICVMRPARDHRSWQLKETVRRSHHHIELWLDPLSANESSALVGNLLHIEGLPLELRQRILAHAEGNPFYVEEIVRSLIDSETILYDESQGQWRAMRSVADIDLPDTLHGLLTARIDRLQKETKHVLRLASVIGRTFFYRVLAQIAREEAQLDTRLLTLQQEQLIRERARLPELEYIFKHELTREAAYNGLMKKERSAYHRQVAEALERLFVERAKEIIDLLAYHWEQAGQAEQAIIYLRQAGERAAAQFANAQAVDYYSRALALAPAKDDQARFDILMAREKVYSLQGDRQAQEGDLAALASLAEKLDDVEKRARIVLRRANHTERISDYDGVIQAAQQVTQLARACRADDLEAGAYLKWGIALYRQGNFEAAREQFERAVALIQSIKTPPLARTTFCREVEADSLRFLGHVLHDGGEWAEGMSYYEQSLRVCLKAGFRRRQAYVLSAFSTASGHRGDNEKSRTFCEQALQVYRDIGDPEGIAIELVNLSNNLIAQGDYSDAEKRLRQSLHLARKLKDPMIECVVLISVGYVFFRQGAYRQARCHIEQGLDTLHKVGAQEYESEALYELGCVFHQLGDDEAALTYHRQALRIAQGVGHSILQARILEELGQTLVSQQQLPEATHAYREALEALSELENPGFLMAPLAGLAHIALIQGERIAALEHVDTFMDHLNNKNVNHLQDPFRIYLFAYQVLEANDDPRATQVLTAAYNLVQKHASGIDDERLRRSFLENVAVNREIVVLWQEQQNNLF